MLFIGMCFKRNINESFSYFLLSRWTTDWSYKQVQGFANLATGHLYDHDHSMMI